MDNSVVVSLRDIVVEFDGQRILDGLNLDIHDKEFVTLLGSSGCGKTTTLRMIAGFESPDEGEIYLGGQPINELTPNKRDTAMVFQSYALLPHYNVFDNVVVEGKQYNRPFKASKCMFFKLNDRNVASFVNETLEQYSQMMALAMKSYKDTCGQKYKVVLDRAPSGDVDEEKKYQDFLAGNLKTFIENANAVYMETRGQRLEPVKTEGGAEPADITALRKEIYDAAAVAFKIPRPIMYGDMTNMGDLVNVMLTFAVDPEAQMFSEEATRKNYTQEEICDGGCKIKVDTTTIKHVDIFDVAPSVMNLISSGVRTIDDVNEALGRENSEITSARLMTKNLGAIEDVLREAKQGGESK